MEMETINSDFNRGTTTVCETQVLSKIPPQYPLMKNTTEAPKKVTVIDDFPEGGAKAWASVVGSFCMVFISQGAIYAFGVYQDFYTRIFLSEHSPSQIAWIGSLQPFLVFFLGLFAGKLFDEGYFHHLMITGSVIYLFSFFMLSLAQPHHYYQVFLAQGVGVGIGMGLICLPSLTLGFHYFKRRRGVAVGIISTGSAIGAICQTIGLNHLINGKVGFAWGVRIFGFIFLILAIIGNVLMRPRLLPRKRRPENQLKPDVKKIVQDIPLLLLILGLALMLFSVFFPHFSLGSSAVSAYVDNTHEVGFALGYATFLQSFFVLIAQPVAGAIVDAPRYRWNRAIVAVSWLGYDSGISYDVGQTEEDVEGLTRSL
ncbi:hypothetical protein Clacol_003104 [Clathrus columnatus]|uniref:MFS general substrate transporter n=1 Tax=Clathrus columnatus TaxID=1419009 RepID=A0AAV5A6K1_9AGAM|nr:hypothetical protein Clacol_003104 [Clathrus columnatus]